MTIPSSEEKGGSVIPKQVLDNLSTNEDILFNINTKFVKGIVTLTKFSIPIMELVFILSIFVIYLLRGVNWFSDNLQILMSVMLVVVGIAFWLYVTKSSFGKTSYLLLITNKSVLLLQKYNHSEDLEKIDLFSIEAIISRKNKTLGAHTDSGTIDFIWNMGKALSLGKPYYRINRTTIRNVPNITKNMKVIESIFFHFGNIYEKWEKIKSDKKIKIPYEIKPSAEVHSKINRNVKIYNVVHIFCWIFLIMGLIVLFIPNRIVWLISLLIIALSVSSILTDLRTNFNLRKVRVSQDNTLQLYENKAIVLHNGNSVSFNFNPDLQLDFIILRYRFAKKDYSFIGTIKIKSSSHSSLKRKIGPYKDYLQNLEIIYLNYLVWKNNHKLLLTKEMLVKLSTIYLQPDNQNLKSKQEKIIISWKNFQDIPLDSILIPENKILEIRNHFNLNERILTTYKPQFKNYKIIIPLILLIIGIISFILGWIMDLTILIIPGMILILMPGLVLSSETRIKNSLFIFTTLRLIAVYKNKITYRFYNDIASIILKEKKKHNTIIITAKPSSKEDPEDIRDITLFYLLKESQLYEKLLFLKKKAENNTYSNTNG